MSSETITRNDLTAILNEVLPIKPSEYRKLLWTNPNSTYSTGTVSLDLSDFDEVEILFYADDSFSTAFFSRTKIGKIGSAGWWNVRTDLSNLNNINCVTREYSVSTSGVTFQNGNMIYNGASYAGWSGRCVPYQIYGIKYEQVLPPAEDALAWKLKGTASGNNTVAMPTDYNEIMLVATGYSTYFFTAIVPKSEISSSNIAPRFASYYNANNNAGGYWLVNSSTASLGSYQANGGTNVLSQATFKLYYR